MAPNSRPRLPAACALEFAAIGKRARLSRLISKKPAGLLHNERRYAPHSRAIFARSSGRLLTRPHCVRRARANNATNRNTSQLCVCVSASRAKPNRVKPACWSAGFWHPTRARPSEPAAPARVRPPAQVTRAAIAINHSSCLLQQQARVRFCARQPASGSLSAAAAATGWPVRPSGWAVNTCKAPENFRLAERAGRPAGWLMPLAEFTPPP